MATTCTGGCYWWGFGPHSRTSRRPDAETAWLNGSFVTTKEEPNDFDACWDETGVDPEALDPVLLTFDRERAAQKAKYMGELFPSTTIANLGGWSFLDFFQTDRETGRRKGIVAIDLGGLG